MIRCFVAVNIKNYENELEYNIKQSASTVK